MRLTTGSLQHFPFFSKSRNYFVLTSENLKKLTQIPRIMDLSQNSGTLVLDQVLWTWNHSESLAACELWVRPSAGSHTVTTLKDSLEGSDDTRGWSEEI